MTEKRFQIGDLCRMEKGISPTLKTPPGPYPLVVTADFRRSADTWQIDAPAVCVPLISSTGHGDAALHRVHYQDGKFALANLLVALIPTNPSVCDAKYLYHLLMARKDELLVPLMQGTANVSLKEKDIAKMEISLPPIDKQRRVVATLSRVSDAVSVVRNLRLDQERDIKGLLGGTFGKIAADALCRPLDEVAPLVRRPITVESNEMYAELGVRSFGKGTFHKPSLSGLEIGTKRIFQIQPGDLVFSNVFAWEGAIAVARQEDAGRVGSHRFITCVANPAIATAEFLCFYFLTDEGLERIGKASPGGAGRNRTLGITALERIPVPVPSIDAQRKFGELLAKVGMLRKLQAEADASLDALLRSVLSKAFAREL